MIHEKRHALCGRLVYLRNPIEDPMTGQMVGRIEVEDWWDRVAGYGWQESESHGNIAARVYGVRAEVHGLPLDDNVVYGYDDGGFGHLIHTLEINAVGSDGPLGQALRDAKDVSI